MNEVLENKILKVMSASTCFGIAYDSEVSECKQCDVSEQCKKKSAGANLPTPQGRAKEEVSSSDKKDTSSSKPKSTTKPSKVDKPKATKDDKPKTLSPDAPNFKEMTLDQLKNLADERKVAWSDYGSDNITRMRLIMNLKKDYQE